MNKGNLIKTVHLPTWDQLPAVDLYLEQMLKYVNDSLCDYVKVNPITNEVITKTMVNNYVKKGFIEAPKKKKYNKLTIASLIVIAILKSVFSMEEIAQLITLAIDSNTPRESYDNFCKKLELATEAVKCGRYFNDEDDPKDPRNICFAACFTFASQYFVKKIYLEC